jgi:hypothetical protein
MFTCSGYTAHRAWCAHYKDDNDDAIDDATQAAVLKQQCKNFLGWLLLHVGSVGTNGRRQLFYLAFVCQYYGLSRDGIAMLNSYGYSVTMDMHDKMKTLCFGKAHADTRYCVCVKIFLKIFLCCSHIFLHKQSRIALSKPHFLWVDNFAKTLARSVPTLNVGAYNACYWSGAVVFPCNDLSVTDAVRRDDLGDIVAAMPDDLFVHKHTVVRAVTQLQPRRDYLSMSYVLRYDVRNIPPKVDTKIWKNLDSVINSPLNRLGNIQPKELMSDNIGSNLGLLCIIKKLYDDKGMSDDTADRYTSLNVDENIYYRILKVTLLVFVCVFEVLRIGL